MTKPEKKWIIASGKHSRRDENGEVTRFYTGDLIDPTPEELESFPDKFILLADFEARVAMRARERGLGKKTAPKPPNVRRKDRQANREPEAVARGEKAMEIRRGSERRTMI